MAQAVVRHGADRLSRHVYRGDRRWCDGFPGGSKCRAERHFAVVRQAAVRVLPHRSRPGVCADFRPNFASYALLRFEINVRASSIVGFVGAGGIGQDLFVAIRKFYYTDVSAILLMIIFTVV